MERATTQTEVGLWTSSQGSDSPTPSEIDLYFKPPTRAIANPHRAAVVQALAMIYFH
jgi:hypothetical protein